MKALVDVLVSSHYNSEEDRDKIVEEMEILL